MDKRLTRAIKNRQSAQASRERHRRYVAQLELERDALLSHSTQMTLKVAQLEVEKARLALELETLRRDWLKSSSGGSGVCGGEEQPAVMTGQHLPSISLNGEDLPLVPVRVYPLPPLLPPPSAHLRQQSACMKSSVTSSTSNKMMRFPRRVPRSPTSKRMRWRRMAHGLVQLLIQRYSGHGKKYPI